VVQSNDPCRVDDREVALKDVAEAHRARASRETMRQRALEALRPLHEIGRHAVSG
jgi:hypothetical protein